MASETYIRVYDDVMPAARCRAIIEAFHGSPFVIDGMAQETAGVTNVKVCKELYLLQVYHQEKDEARRALWQEIYKDLYESCNPRLIEYVEEFKYLAGKPFADEGFRVKQYPKGTGKFDLHIDQTPNTPTRVFAMILYLNDVAEGGETEFPDYGLKVQPRAGRLLISPTSWTHGHRGLVPLSEDKYIVNNFAIFIKQNNDPGRAIR